MPSSALGRALLLAAFLGAAPAGAQETGAPPIAPLPQAVPSAAPSAVTPDPTPPAGSETAPPSIGAPPAPAANAALPHDLSPLGMFRQADIVVKAVMIGLVLASIATWTVWLAKSLQLIGARRSARAAGHVLETCGSLPEAAEKLGFRKGDVSRMIRAASAEARLSEGASANLKERVGSRLDRLEAAGGRRMMAGTGILATIGSTAPFVGLFGTVWGIMNAFVGISRAQTTNLAVVAPGIAEALLATAIGLVAAIPAVVFYNMFARQIAGYRALLADASAEIQRLVSRDLDRHRPYRVRAVE